MLRHVIVSASYEGGCVPVSVMQNGVREVIIEEGCTPVHARAWTSAHFTDPRHESLLDAWIDLSDEDRIAIRQSMPRLFSAIYFAVGGVSPRQDECEATSAHGSRCAVEGDHSVHVSAPHSTAGSEVWR